MIKNTLYQNGVKEIFRLRVIQGNYAGIYDIKKPSEFDDIDCNIDIDEENFNVNNFILGESSKVKFIQYYDPDTFELVKNVYNEQGGDAEIIFIWQYEEGETITDVLDENYSLNLNKYKEGFEESRGFIETEIKKRDSQNLLLVREDTSVNLFNTTNLDNNQISTVNTTEIYYKEGGRTYTNFYFLTTSSFGSVMFRRNDSFMFTFIRGENPEFGNNDNIESGYIDYPLIGSKYNGPLLTNTAPLNNLELEISNMFVGSVESSSGAVSNPFKLYALKKQGGSEYERILIESSTQDELSGAYFIKIVNEKYDLGSTLQNTSIDLLFVFDNNYDGIFINLEDRFSIELRTKTILPIRRSKSVLLKDAINQICKQYTNSSLTLQSSLIDNNGKYEKTSISTGLFLRGISELYLGVDKLTTSLKDLLYDSTIPLIGLGFDIINDKLVIEDLQWFFKDLQCYDLTDKEFIREDYSIENDSDIIYNNLVFGTKKYSTNNQGDITNFNTSMEVSTPIKSIKNKLDKTANCIIDNKKIQELILDTSSSTNDSDDDLILIDLVELDSYVDNGVFVNCSHENNGGYLWLTCYETPFDTLALDVGMTLNITGGLNIGSWQILEINKATLRLNRTSGIEQGVSDTIVNYLLTNIIKNRTNEGFSTLQGVEDVNSVANVRHNPKYQMARWFPFFGGGLVPKNDNDNLIVSKYKNNGDVTVNWSSIDLDNEISGLTTLDQNEILGRLRAYKVPFFNGKKIEITLVNVGFDEFYNIYKNWRFGINGDYTTSRGYFTININGVNMNVYAFGESAISYSRKENHLTIRGKVKNIQYNEEEFKIFDYTFDYTFE